MGRRRNNPELVDELIDGLWTMPQNEFEEKYNTLSSGDMTRVSNAINHMNDITLDPLYDPTWRD